MMMIFSSSSWTTILDWARLALARWSLANCSPILLWERLSFRHIFTSSMITIRMEIFKHMIPLRWLILNLHFISSFFIMLVSWRYPWDITQSYYSRHTFHRINSLMTNIWITWQASSIWSLRDGSSWTCTSFLLSLSCWCLEGTHEISLHLIIQDTLSIGWIISWPMFVSYGKLQAYDPYEMAHLDLALHLFFLYHVGVLKVPMRYHSILWFKTPFP